MTAADALRLGASAVGGKADALARLAAAGERVPPFVVIPAEALPQALLRAGVHAQVVAALEALAADRDGGRAATVRAARVLQEIVDRLPAPELAVAHLAPDIAGATCAVRSSAVGEDGATQSFAGQLESLLHVHPHALGDAVRACWRSAFGERVLDYRRRGGSLADAPRLAVIVQRMIPGEVSGVLFTADPLTGDPGRMRVSACAGLGDALVSGEADADEYLLTRDGDVLETMPVGTPVLHPAQLRALAALGRRIAEREGGERDIEWTIGDGVPWLLQSRPITTMTMAAPRPPQAGGGSDRIVWDNSNIEESYCGVTTPLTFSFASSAYASVYEQTMRTVGIPEHVIAAHRPLLANLLGLLNGRVYYNLNSWYRGLTLLPSFGRNKADMERMMGVTEPVDFVQDERVTVAERLRRLPGLLRTAAGLLLAFARLPRAVPAFLAEFDARIAAVDRATLPDRPLPELMSALDTLWSGCVERWTTPIVNDFRVMMATGRLRRLVERARPGRTDALMQVLLGGADVAVSAGPATLMLRLAGVAREDEAVAAAFRVDTAPAVLLRRAEVASPEFARVLGELHDTYGDRCMGELKLESRPLRDDPAFTVRMVRNYLQAGAHDDGAAAVAGAARRAEAEREVAGALPLLRRRRFAHALSRARAAIRAREEMRLARTRLFGTHRDVYHAIGRRLHEAGLLEAPADILWLTTHEVRALWSGTSAAVDLVALVRVRRAEFARYESMRMPNRVVTTGVPAIALARMAEPRRAGAPEPHATVLRGLGCSAGVAEGRVRIVRGADDDLALDGHILVAPRTDPGWAPLFPSAAAIVVERGSLLSHSAVLARELGLPAVVGIPGVLDLLRDGELVRVDGSAGTIERLEAP